VPDRHNKEATISDFEVFISYIVDEVKKRPDEPVKQKGFRTYEQIHPATL
jgi:hypothetical protein